MSLKKIEADIEFPEHPFEKQQHIFSMWEGKAIDVARVY